MKSWYDHVEVYSSEGRDEKIERGPNQSEKRVLKLITRNESINKRSMNSQKWHVGPGIFKKAWKYNGEIQIKYQYIYFYLFFLIMKMKMVMVAALRNNYSLIMLIGNGV